MNMELTFPKSWPMPEFVRLRVSYIFLRLIAAACGLLSSAEANQLQKVPPLPTIIAASAVLTNGDIPVDTFTPPTNAVYVAQRYAGGSDTNLGTFLAPFEHIDAAIQYANAHPEPLTIFIRGGTYVYKALMPYQKVQRGNLYVTGYPGESVFIQPVTWPGNPTDESSQFAFEVTGGYTNITFDNLVLQGWQIGFMLGSDDKYSPLRNITLKNIRGDQFKNRSGDPGFTRSFLETAYHAAGFSPFEPQESAQYQIENLLISNIVVQALELGIQIGDENNANVRGLRICQFSLHNPPPGGNDTSQDGFPIVGCKNVLIDECTLENVAGDGIDLKSYNVVIVNTIVSSVVRNAVKFWHNGELINCILYNSTAVDDGILIVKNGGPCRVIQSAIISKPFRGYAGTLFGTGPAAKVQFVNSIFSDLPSWFLIETTNIISINCLYHITNGIMTSAGAPGGYPDILTVNDLNQLPGCSGNISGLPGLVNPTGGDFAPSASSICINAAATNGLLLPAFDFFGNPRIIGGLPDIGPIEYAAGVNADVGLTISALQPIGMGGTHFVVKWMGRSGFYYDLVVRTNASSSASVVQGFSGIPGSDSFINYTNETPQKAQFYQIVLHE